MGAQSGRMATGRKTGGRRKGTPNRRTAEMRAGGGNKIIICERSGPESHWDRQLNDTQPRHLASTFRLPGSLLLQRVRMVSGPRREDEMRQRESLLIVTADHGFCTAGGCLEPPQGYTHVVEVTAPARLVYVAGQLGNNGEGEF